MLHKFKDPRCKLTVLSTQTPLFSNGMTGILTWPKGSLIFFRIFFQELPLRTDGVAESLQLDRDPCL